MNFHALFLKCVYFIILPFTLISYLLEPLSDDLLTYMGTAKVTALTLTPSFPLVLDSVWESRFIGSRFLYYVLHLLDPFEGLAYTVWFKLIGAIVMIVIIYYFSQRVAARMHWSFDYLFIITFLGVFAVQQFIIFSAEAHSVIISLLMIVMLLDDRHYVQAMSGLLIIPLLTLKGLPVLLVFIVMLAIMMILPDVYVDRFKRAAWSIPVVIISLIGMALYFPHFVSDIFLIRIVNHAIAVTPVHIISSFFWNWMGMIGMVPVIVIGFCCILLLMSVIVRKHMRDLGLLLLMWLVASVYVVYVSEFWYYHYYLMLVPAVLTISYFLSLWPDHQDAFVLMIVAVMVVFIAFIAGWSPGMAGIQYKVMAGREPVVLNITTHTDLLSQPSTLYLDTGAVAFYFPTPSACRYVGSFPYQRDMPNYDMTDTLAYWEDHNCSLNYTGKYIIVNSGWFNMTSPTHHEIAEKIQREYVDIYPMIGNYSGVGGTPWYWDVYQRR